MATREEKNTISNIYRLRSLEELENSPKQQAFDEKEGEKVFINKTIGRIVKDTQPPVDLWHGLWHQGEMACLFGEPNVGKTILSMKIAADIIKREERVLYFDFENAEHQLLPRYPEIDKHENYANYLEVLTINHANYQIEHDNHTMLDYIKRECLLRNVNIIIIDDITHIFGSGNQQDVRFVLNELRSWTKQLRLTILVLAHSKKKGTNKLANIEQLAGSFECAYAFDSIFSLNKANHYNASKHGITHYIKQHKTRMGAIQYDDNNVISLAMRFDEQTNSLTMCDFCFGANERQLVRDYGYYTDDEIINAIIAFKEKFYTIREIAELVGVSKSQVGRILKEHYKPHKPENVINLKPLPPIPDSPINPYAIVSQEYIDYGEQALLYDDDDNPNIFLTEENIDLRYDDEEHCGT